MVCVRWLLLLSIVRENVLIYLVVWLNMNWLHGMTKLSLVWEIVVRGKLWVLLQSSFKPNVKSFLSLIPCFRVKTENLLWLRLLCDYDYQLCGAHFFQSQLLEWIQVVVLVGLFGSYYEVALKYAYFIWWNLYLVL